MSFAYRSYIYCGDIAETLNRQIQSCSLFSKEKELWNVDVKDLTEI